MLKKLTRFGGLLLAGSNLQEVSVRRQVAGGVLTHEGMGVGSHLLANLIKLQKLYRPGKSTQHVGLINRVLCQVVEYHTSVIYPIVLTI